MTRLELIKFFDEFLYKNKKEKVTFFSSDNMPYLVIDKNNYDACSRDQLYECYQFIKMTEKENERSKGKRHKLKGILFNKITEEKKWTKLTGLKLLKLKNTET